MKIDHIGYAVKNIEKAIAGFEALGYQFEPVVPDEDRNVYISFGENDGYRVELIAPMDKSKESPVDGVLSKNGAAAYHICYKSANLEEEIEKLQKERFRVVINPAPAVAFGGKRVVFMMNLSVGLLEIVEE